MFGETRAGEDDPGDEGPQHRLDVEPLGDHTEGECGDEHHGHPGELVTPVGSNPFESGVDDSLPDREGNDEEHDEPDDGEGELVELEATGLRKTGDEAQGDPADDIVGHTGRKGELAEVAAHEAHLTEDLGDHRERRDRQGGGDEEGEDVPLGVTADEGHREEPTDGEAGDRRNQQRPRRHDHGGAAEPADQPEVSLEAGADEQEQHAEPADGEEHAGLDVVGGEQPVGDVGGEFAEYRRAEDETGGKFADHSRLADALHHRTEQPGGHQDHEQTDPEDEELVFGRGVEAHDKLRTRRGFTMTHLPCDVPTCRRVIGLDGEAAATLG